MIFKLKLFLKSFLFAFKSIKHPMQYFLAILLDKSGVLEFKNGLSLLYDDSGSLGLIIAIYMQEIYGNDFKDKIVVDIGANRGYFTLFAQIQGAKQIYAFEPIIDTFNVLEANVNHNKSQNIKLVRKAIGSVNTKELKIYKAEFKEVYSMDNLENTSTFEIVEMVSFKEMFKSIIKDKYIDILKLNCEGAEYDILLKTPLAILHKVDKIRMEYHNYKTVQKVMHVSEIIEYMCNNGFKIDKYIQKVEKHGIIWFSKS